MVRFIKNLFVLPPLQEYAIPAAPVKPVTVVTPVKDVSLAENESVRNGHVWRTDWEAPLTVTMEKVSTAEVTPQNIALDGMDIACLNLAGLKADARARVMKWHWEKGDSAERIEEAHRVGKKLESGYSERTASKYIKAFYEAKAQREAALQKT